MIVLIALVLDSCSSGKNAYERGNYYEAVTTSINRLRRNPDNKKSRETLRQAYPLAVKYYEDRANTALASGDQFKWSAVVQSYTLINSMYDEIKRSPGALQVVPKPVNYYSKLEMARTNAAEENYAAGIVALASGSREQAKLAYQYFVTTNEFVQGYKDVDERMEAALWSATIKVVLEPIPVVARNVQVSTDFFNDKMSEYLHSVSINPFVRFFTMKEAQTTGVQPDHIVKLAFDDFVIGQVYLSEKQILLQRDSVIVGSYYTEPAVANKVDEVVNRTIAGPGGKTLSGSNVQPPASGGQATQQGSASAEQSGSVETNRSTDSGSKATTNSGGPVAGENQGSADLASSGSEEEKESKVTICHIPPGNKSNSHTLVVGQSALQAHLSHGDALGFCDQVEGNRKGSGDEKGQGTNTGNNEGQDHKPKPGGQSMLRMFNPSYTASIGAVGFNSNEYSAPAPPDTNYVYATVKATYYQFQKTVASRGIVNFSIVDRSSNALLAVEKMPGQFIWVSEWAYFNGDERALTMDQLAITRQREQVPPDTQSLFTQFTIPIFEQVTSRIRDFYRNY